MANTATSPERIRIGIAALERRLGWHRTTIWRKYQANPPEFPAPHYIAERRMWWLDAIEAWEREQAARPPESRRGAANLKKAAGQ